MNGNSTSSREDISDAYLNVALSHGDLRGNGDLGLIPGDSHQISQLTGLTVNLDSIVEELLLKKYKS